LKRHCFFILALALAALNCSESHRPPSGESSRTESFSVREGRRLYGHYCSPCHGESGDGFGKYFGYGQKTQPPDFTAPDFFHNRNDSLLILTISEGSVALGKSNLCPPWGKTMRREEIMFIVNYIKTFKSLGVREESQ
jgi:mono/diheme cytochrome c family protein